MKPIFVPFILCPLLLACGEYEPSAPPDFTPEDGNWSGITEQDRSISFCVTSEQTVGDIELQTQLPDFSGLTWYIPLYEEYGEDKSWSRNVEFVSWPAGHLNTLSIQGQFSTSDECYGSFTAQSETYQGGYFIQAEFTATPE